MFQNILITGGAGYIGSHTASAFLEKGYGVVIVDDLSTGYLEAVPEGAGFVKANIHDVDEIVDIITKNEIEGVVHLAAKINELESIEEPLDYYANNTGGVISILKACQQAGVNKFVFSSTAAAYEPNNPYGNSKYFSECIIRDYGKAYGMTNVILRNANVAGAAHDIKNGQRSKNSNDLIKDAAETALGIKTQLKIKNEKEIRDTIHVEDLADLYTLAFEYMDEGGNSDIFNCGYGHGYSVGEVVDTMKKVSGVDFKVIETDRGQGFDAGYVANNEKIKKLFHWSPKRDNLELICQSAFEWESLWQKRMHAAKMLSVKSETHYTLL